MSTSKSARSARSARPAAGVKAGKSATGSKLGPSTGSRVTRPEPEATPQVTTIRLNEAVQKGLRILEAHSGVRRPLNKWVNTALAELIDRRAASVEAELERALRSIKAYRKTDPGYKRALEAFIDGEVAFAAEDPMEGSREPRATGPAVSMVREMLRG